MTPISVEEERNREKPNIKGDRLNILLLLFLYMLQGVIGGLIRAVPLILQNRKATYTDQAEFSFVSLAFCFKLLWAPIVDCMYSKKIGRRKTWIIPTQYLIGIALLLVSMNVDDWLGSEDGTRKPKIHVLTIVFSSCVFLGSAQDIALDGWSLTMLQKRNVGYAGICSTFGFAAGQFLAFILFIILDSKEFCNKFRSVPQDHGFVSFADFMFFWATVIIVTTTLIFIFKKESNLDVAEDENEYRLGVQESYQYLWQILKIRPIQNISLILLTYWIGFGPVQDVAPLKLIDAGVPRENFVLLTIPLLPFQLILPFLLSRYLVGSRSMRSYIIINMLKIFIDIVYTIFIFFTPNAKDQNNQLPAWYYCLLLFIYNLDNFADYTMRIAYQAFFCRISDPRFGGMYLTLLNSMSNIGFRWPGSLSLWLVDRISVKSCTVDGSLENMNNCDIIFDGFYMESILFISIGIVWLRWSKKQIYKLEKMDPSIWVVKKNSNIIQDH